MSSVPEERDGREPWRLGRYPAAVSTAAGLLTAGLVVGFLYWAQAVLIPFALAVLLTFVLAPLVSRLQRWRVPRVAAVVLVVTAIGGGVAGLGVVVRGELIDFANQLPRYQDNIKEKIADIKSFLHDGPIGKVKETIEKASEQAEKEIEEKKRQQNTAAKRSALKGWWGRLADFFQPVRRDLRRDVAEPAEEQNVAGTAAEDDADSDESEKPVPVEVKPGTSTFSEAFESLKPAMRPLLSVGVVVVLVLFMLVRREDLRNRVVSLAGGGNMAVTTQVVGDVLDRISRYLLMQLVINGTFGLAVGIGLALIGVPYAVLWGLCAAVLRYIPYVGPWVAAALPISVSLITSAGWSQVLTVAGLFVVLELLSNNLMEPLLYGHSVGVSEVGILVSAAFWTWLWGPIGLVLSTPLTVCLVVLGKHVPCFSCFYTLLGDEPVIEPHFHFYQRLLARDQAEALKVVRNAAGDGGVEAALDEVVLPALSQLRSDIQRGIVDGDDARLISQATRAIIADLADEFVARPAKADRQPSPAQTRRAVWGCPARDEIDATALEALRCTLESEADLQILDEALLTSEVVAAIDRRGEAALICVASLSPGGQARTRYLCKRLRRRLPEAKIVVGRWGSGEASDITRQRLKDAGAGFIESTLRDTRVRLKSLIQLRIEQSTGRSGPAPAA